MKTKTRTYKSKNNTVYERDTDTLSSYSISFKESKEISDSLIKFFPILISYFLLFMFSIVVYSAIIKNLYFIAAIFIGLSSIVGIFAIRKIFKRKHPYTFFWNPISLDTINIQNSHNYRSAAKLTKMTKSKFWKFIYFSDYYYKILFSILWLPVIGIMTIVFTMESFGTLPSLPFILSIVFWPMIISCIKLWKSLIKIRSQIYSNKNNFYYISMNSKSLWFTIKENIKWWINYYFQK